MRRRTSGFCSQKRSGVGDFIRPPSLRGGGSEDLARDDFNAVLADREFENYRSVRFPIIHEQMRNHSLLRAVGANYGGGF